MLIDEKGCMYIKQGGFYYNVSGNDALILHKYLGYKLYGVKTYRTGFPVIGQDTVLAKLNQLGMDYDLFDQDGNLLISKRFTPNRYEVIDESEFPYAILKREEDIELPKFKKSSKPKQSQHVRFMYILQALSEGANPYTGELIAGIDDELKDALLEILMYFDKKEKIKAEKKEKFSNVGQRWTQEEDEQLIEEYKAKIDINEIAILHGRSRGSINSRLLHLHLIEL